jgi:alpha-glucoside transport system permease protein
MFVTAQQVELFALGAAGAPIATVLVVRGGERLLRPLRPRQQARLRPWLWLSPALLLITLILIYPIVSTVYLSLRNASGTRWSGLDNFAWAFGSAMRPVLRNNVLWVVAFPLISVALGLIVAVLFERVRYEKFARTVIVLPTAISFTAGSLLWSMMYQYQPPGQPQTGTIDALWVDILRRNPIAWLIDPRTNNFALIFVAVWMSLGIAALILSAGVKGVSSELTEAARIDGAGEWRIFKGITLPLLWPTVLVVWTVEVIFALKVFDIVYVMTDGNYGTNTVATEMYSELFLAQNYGHAAAIAVILLIAAFPIVWMNVRQVRRGQSA